MLENGKIGVRQLTILVILISIGDAILVLPSIPAIEAKQDAWISVVIGLAIGLPIVYLLTIVGKLYPGLTVVEYNEKILGTWLGKAISLFFLSYLFFSAAAHLRESSDFMITNIMPETPIMAINILFLGIIVMGARLGLETLTRTAEILFPWFILLLLMFILFLIPQADIKNMLPVLGEGIKPVIRGSIASAAFPFAELVVFLMVFPYVNQTNRIRRSFLLGALLGGIVLIAIVALSILVLGADLVARNIYPSFFMAKKISIGNFLERVEAILAIIWFISIYFKITLYYYAFNLGLAQTLKLREYRFLTLPSGMILLLLSLMVAPNITYYNEVISKYWPNLDFTYSILLPLLLLGVYALRKKFKRNM
ncbi:GerAB/ArcD/ProY family transporter [Cohnella luojiensis]|uniref:Spore gernimation protein n=1 Tax=Cohnella luojiensis TaxID=652876 RepID=A0A4Y8LZ46_9BACL|nr:endospore germination permease [Cohnella luojiensis]TFE26626.1 spore gernimation protein [Cohnella luojiensis]